MGCAVSSLSNFSATPWNAGDRYCPRDGAALTRRHFGAVVLGVLALHAMLPYLLDEPPAAVAGAVPPKLAAALQVRTLASPLSVRAEATPAVAMPVRRQAAPGPRALAATPPMPAPVAVPPAEPPAAAAASPPGDLPPVYRTLPPPAFAFGYELQRGTQRGSVELQWRADGGQYQARLAGTLAGAPLMAWHSVGAFDAAGLAPQRYTDRRKGRSLQAANFQRDAGKITFSGPAVEHALAPGAQDRLSWMLQLAAIAAAEPSLVGPGGRVSFVVVGVHGQADVWTFVHVGEETLALPEGDAQAVRLLREPGRAYDTRAEVWLDPTRHYLPVQARLSNPPQERDALQIVWREALATP